MTPLRREAAQSALQRDGERLQEWDVKKKYCKQIKKLKITKTLWIQLCESHSERFCFKPQMYLFKG